MKKNFSLFYMAYKIYEFISTLNQGVYAAALGETVVSTGSNNPVMLTCNHEDTDTRLV